MILSTMLAVMPLGAVAVRRTEPVLFRIVIELSGFTVAYASLETVQTIPSGRESGFTVTPNLYVPPRITVVAAGELIASDEIGINSPKSQNGSHADPSGA